ncbi:MAG: LppP/LprE family lipoprotein [Leptolyngbya sp. BL-A-14]
MNDWKRMHGQSIGFATAILLALGTMSGAIAQPSGKPFWLDQAKPTNWNKPGASLPKAPSSNAELDNFQQCKTTVRPATAPEDKALSSAGWKLVGPYQRFGKVSLVTGFSGVDGMCRPMGYQDFVFVNGKFAGTLSPQPMDSRTDGASGRLYLFSETELSAEFARYKEADALCCPSAESNVSYQIRQQNGQSIVAPTDVYTNPTSP